MKKLECYIRPSKLDTVIAALVKADIPGLSVTHVKGHGVQKGFTEIYRGTERKVNLLTKVRLDIVVSAVNVEKAAKIVMEASRTGEVGDGKIFILPVEGVYRIRTGETGRDAIS